MQGKRLQEGHTRALGSSDCTIFGIVVSHLQVLYFPIQHCSRWNEQQLIGTPDNPAFTELIVTGSKSVIMRSGVSSSIRYSSTAYFTIFKASVYYSVVLHVRRAYTYGSDTPSPPTDWRPRNPNTLKSWVKSDGLTLKVPSMNQVLLLQSSSRFCLVPNLKTLCVAEPSSTSSSSFAFYFSGREWKRRNFSPCDVLWNPFGNSPSSENALGLVTGLVVSLFVIASIALLVLAVNSRHRRTRRAALSEYLCRLQLSMLLNFLFLLFHNNLDSKFLLVPRMCMLRLFRTVMQDDIRTGNGTACCYCSC